MRTDRYMGMEGIGGMAGFGSLNFLKWQRCGTATSSDIKRHSYDCLRSLFERTVLQCSDQSIQVSVLPFQFQSQSHGVKMW